MNTAKLEQRIQEVYFARHFQTDPKLYDILLDEEIKLQHEYKHNTGQFYKIPDHLGEYDKNDRNDE